MENKFTNMHDRLHDFCLNLYHIGCLKLGRFILKNGKETFYYIDLRILISYPMLMDEMCDVINLSINQDEIEFDCICGVPYTALPFSTLISVKINKPMVMKRKETKSYGTRQLIEGKFKEGNVCIVIDDVISSGSSILETIVDIESVGIVVKDVFAVVDREEGGVQNLINRGYRVHCLFTLNEILQIFSDSKVIGNDIIAKIRDQQMNSKIYNRFLMPYEKRIPYCKSAIASKLFSVMAEKKTNLCVSANVIDAKDLLQLADNVGRDICLLKIQADIVENFSVEASDELRNIANRHNFLIMEDKKLTDTENTARMHFNKVSKWADLISVHTLPGFGVLESINIGENYNENFGVFLIAELSNPCNLITPDYSIKTVSLAEKYPKLVAGLFCQFSNVFSHPGFIQITLDVSMNEGKMSEERYCTPNVVIEERKADIAVVGEDIVSSENPKESAAQYKQVLWEAYMKRTQS